MSKPGNNVNLEPGGLALVSSVSAMGTLHIAAGRDFSRFNGRRLPSTAESRRVEEIAASSDTDTAEREA
jgi:hypothetical protein